ncbi:MAG: carbohydrate ABC transporter permease [Bacillota bacterium]|nr:carbohydrate ABC transporter permease [Bacillota bacterium]
MVLQPNTSLNTIHHRSRLNQITPLQVLNHVLIAFFAVVCILPMVLVLMVSFTSDAAIKLNGYQLIPQELSVSAYKMIFSPRSSIVPAYGVSLTVTFVGTLVAVAITGMAAFTLSNKSVQYRNALAFFFFIPMIFNAGLVPWYMICRALGLRNNLLALIVPSLLFSAYNMYLCRNFMNGIPDSFMESAKLDGASDAHIAFRIYFPLSKPVLAAVALFYGVAYWNDWFNAIMLVDNNELYPLQYMLYQIRSQIAALQRLQPDVPVDDLPGESLKMATAIVTIGPIVFLYPYLQKYFVRGLIIGGIKG